MTLPSKVASVFELKNYNNPPIKERTTLFILGKYTLQRIA